MLSCELILRFELVSAERRILLGLHEGGETGGIAKSSVAFVIVDILNALP